MISFLVIVGSGIGIYLIESPYENAQITNLIDAFWWASATVTTVGYGDVVPVTEAGRLFGIGLMFVGISIIKKMGLFSELKILFWFLVRGFGQFCVESFNLPFCDFIPSNCRKRYCNLSY